MIEDVQELDLNQFFSKGPDAVKLFAETLIQAIRRGGGEVVFTNMYFVPGHNVINFRYVKRRDDLDIALVLEPNEVRLEIQNDYDEEEELDEEAFEEISDTIYGELKTARRLALEELGKRYRGPGVNLRKRKRNNTNRNNGNTNMKRPATQLLRFRRSRKTRKVRKTRRA